jgi:hypothetical protein
MANEQGKCPKATPTPEGESEALALSAAVVLDPRLAEIWQLVWSCESADREDCGSGWSMGSIGALLRLAYLQGYADAAAEIVPGSLFTELGLRSPAPVPPKRSRSRRAPGRALPGSSGK